MKLVLIVCCVAMAVFAAPPGKEDEPVSILQFDNNNDGLGNYTYAFETSDGVKKDEQADLLKAGTDEESYVVRGSYSYIGPDGVTYSVTYIADANGFQPQGKHIPAAA